MIEPLRRAVRLAIAMWREGPAHRAVGRIAMRLARVTAEERDSAAVLRVRLFGRELGRVVHLIRADPGDPLGGHWLMSLTVSPIARRWGVGTLLCRAVLDRAGSAGAHSVRLTVRHDHAPAIRLYEKLGFERLPDMEELAAELKRLQDLGGAPYVAMERRLDRRG